MNWGGSGTRSNRSAVQPTRSVWTGRPHASQYSSLRQEEENAVHRNGPTVKHSNSYKIVMILDESASMSSIREKMLESINGFLAEQRTVDRPCRFTLVKFSNDVERKIKNVDLQQVKPLKPSDYTPNGMTALYDAVGDTIDWYRYEKDVLLVIVTDGQENASREYKHKEVKNLLEEKSKFRGWSYVYLANDLSVAAQGDSIGCQRSAMSSNCQVSQEAYGDFIQKDLCEAVKNARTAGASVQMQLNRKY